MIKKSVSTWIPYNMDMLFKLLKLCGMRFNNVRHNMEMYFKLISKW